MRWEELEIFNLKTYERPGNKKGSYNMNIVFNLLKEIIF